MHQFEFPGNAAGAQPQVGLEGFVERHGRPGKGQAPE
jgi:hypothetical protein